MRGRLFSFCLILFLAAKSFGQTTNYVIVKAPFSSPKYDEFSPVYYKGGIVFCSNRTQKIFSGYSTTDNKPFFRLYHADTTRGTQWQESRALQGSVNSNLNNGPATFNRNGDTMYFSRNLITEGNFREINRKENKLGLFFAVLKNGEWTDVQEMRFNDNSWNVTTPYLSPDGKRLYFASDKPDGFGGSDLYYSEWKNGYWNNPVNLGNIVNTAGNEAYPFVNEAGDLFFSSDGLPGKGGKDVFFTRYADTTWTEPVNLNSPVNSPANDFGFISDGMIGRGYFSSDRSGMLDIFAFNTIYPQFLYCQKEEDDNLCFSFSDDAVIDIDPVSLQFTWDFGYGSNSAGYVVQHCYREAGIYTIKQSVTDKKTGKVVFDKTIAELLIQEHRLPRIVAADNIPAGKEVNLSAGIHATGNEDISYFWEINGKPAGRGGSISHVFADGDTPVRLLANVKDRFTGVSRQVCVEKTISVSGSPVSGQSRKGLTATPVKMADGINRKGVSVEKVYSASDELAGKALFAVRVYESPKALATDNKIFADISSRYIIKRVPSEKGYAYLIDEQTAFMAVYSSYKDAASKGFDAKIITYMPTDTGEVELWNFKRTYGTSSDLFFVGNGSTISQKGMPVLDRLILLLKRNPGLKIMIAAHTENSGSSYSNMQLSDRQAQSIVDYLVLNGINRSRLVAKGYGGSRPVAPEFPESERLKNRRVDFIKIN